MSDEKSIKRELQEMGYQFMEEKKEEQKEESAKLIKVINIPKETSIEQLIDILRAYPPQAKVKIPGPLGMASPISKLQIELETEF